MSPCRPAAGANWLKLRAFGLTQYDAVLLVDSNAYISGDIAPLFNLPTDFAASWDQVGIVRKHLQTGWPSAGVHLQGLLADTCNCRSAAAAATSQCAYPCLTAACTLPHLQARWLGSKDSAALRALSGGALFLRPCPTTEAHMLGILRRQGQPPRLPHALALGGGTERQHSSSGGSSGSHEAQDAGPAGPEHEFLAW